MNYNKKNGQVRVFFVSTVLRKKISNIIMIRQFFPLLETRTGGIFSIPKIPNNRKY